MPDHDAAIRSVLDSVYAAWRAGDPDAFVAAYAEGATATLPGARLDGRAAVRATMAAVLGGELAGSEGLHEVQHIRLVAPGVALVTATGAIRRAGESEPRPSTRALESWVLAERDGAWRVESFQSSPATVA